MKNKIKTETTLALFHIIVKYIAERNAYIMVPTKVYAYTSRLLEVYYAL